MCIDKCHRLLSLVPKPTERRVTGLETARKPDDAGDVPAGGWNALIDDIVAGRWTNPETGKLATVPYESIVIEESLDGAEADLIADLQQAIA